MENTQRTIAEVLDLETGEIIDSNSFFNQEEGVIFKDRRQQQEAANGFGEAKFKCIYCEQLIRINGKGSNAGKKNFYFSHLSNSEYCDIKTVGGLTEEEKQERRYAIRRESKRHKELKHFVYDMLLKNMEYTEGVTEAALEQTHFHATLDQFKRPDIFATYKDISIAFEVQLSTIFLDIIIGRDKFYAEHGIFIIWIFNLLNEEQEWQRVMEKDIYYANKRNAFVLNDEAMEISKERNVLFFYCYWQKPIIVGDKIYVEWCKKLISLAELKYDYENHKVYYHDSDADFEKAEQDLRDLINVENKALLELYLSGKMPHTKIEEGRRVGWKYNERILIPCEYSLLKYIGNGFVKGQKRGLANEYGNNKWGVLHIINGVITPCTFDEIEKFTENKIIVGKSEDDNNLKWGCIDEQGNVILPLEFNKIEFFQNGKIKAKKGNKWGCSDEKGELLVPFEFDEIKEFLEGKAIAKKDGKWGRIDEKGGVLIPFEFNEIASFLDGRAEATKNGGNYSYSNRYGKWGYIDEQGKTIIPFEFEKFERFSNGKAIVKKDGKWGYMDDLGKTIIPFEFDEFGSFSNGEIMAKKHGKWGKIDESGNILRPFEFNEIGYFSKGKAMAMKDWGWGIIDEQWNVLIPLEFNEIKGFSEGKAMAKKDWKWGEIDEQGKTLIPFEFDEIVPFLNGLMIALKQREWGGIDEQGKTIIPFEFEKIVSISEGKIKVKRNFNWGVVDLNGKLIQKCDFFYIGNFIDNKAKAAKNYQTGFLYCNEDRLYWVLENGFSEGIAVAQKNDKWGLINEQIVELFPFEFDEIKECIVKNSVRSERRNTNIQIEPEPNVASLSKIKRKFLVKKEDKWGYIDIERNELIACKFDEIEDFKGGRAIAKKDKKYGLINEQGDILIPFEYTKIDSFSGGVAAAQKKGKWGCIDYMGKEIVPFIHQKTEILKQCLRHVQRIKKSEIYKYNSL